jgi:uncharacterized protein
MPGMTDLTEMLKSLEPVMDEKEYLFISVNSFNQKSIEDSWAVIKEDEGYTLILPDNAEMNADFMNEPRFRKITLSVHSSLTAVGLTARISTELAKYSISANVVAGYFHDHIFVQTEKAEKALAVLKNLKDTDF